MKFTLIYDGELGPNGSPKKKWEIRKQLHPQIAQLWQQHPALKMLERNRYVDTTSGYMRWETHHSMDHILTKGEPSANCIDLCEPVLRQGRQFLPLVRERTALRCVLRILFLRREPPGKVYQGGDLDNRLKTLFDALAVPKEEQVVADGTVEDPIYCLLEDDALIMGLNIETHQLLRPSNAPANEVRLFIEVDVRTAQARLYNQPFLGD